MKGVLLYLLTVVCVLHQTTAQKASRSIDPRCPYPDPKEYTVHLPHETDCSKFYKCDHGGLVLFDCPDDLYFDEVLEVCVWPENVNCSNSPVPPSQPPSEAPSSPSTPSSDAPPSLPSNPPDIPSRPPGTTTVAPIPSLSPSPSSSPSIPSRPPVTTTVPPIPSLSTISTSPSDPSIPSLPPSVSTSTTSELPSSSPAPSSPPSSPSGDCPYPDLEYPVFLTDPSDPAKYYECSNGVPYPFECKDGLHFNPYLNVCDYPGFTAPSSTESPPSVAPSDAPSIPSRPPATTTVPPIPSLPSSTSSSSDPPIPSLPQSTSTSSSPLPSSAPALPSGECPYPDPEYPVYLIDPSDPAKYYECSNGVPYPFNCAEGLHFNPYLNVCDYPGFTAPPSSEPSTTASTPGPSGPSGICPLQDPEYPVYLTDLSDPSKFYECSNGVPYPFECKDGLHFNPYLNVCDYPGFTAPSSTESPPSVTPSDAPGIPSRPPATTTVPPIPSLPSSTSSPTDPPIPSLPQSTSTSSSPIPSSSPASPSGECPYPDPEYPVYLTDPSDPAKYYECSNGIPYPFDCAEGLHFNPYLNVCDYPGFTAPPSSESSTTASTPAPSGPSGTCPLPDPEYPVHLTDLSDPTVFYQCSNGVPYKFDCPPGLQFNPKENVCS